jgi:hypothetical protein
VQVPTGNVYQRDVKKNIKNIRKSQVVVPFCSSFNQHFPANKKGCTCVPAKRNGCTSARQKDV